MKKKIVRADGSVEELEGTAEELAEFERRNKTEGVETPDGKKRLLTEDDVRSVAQALDELRKQFTAPPVIITTYPYSPGWYTPFSPVIWSPLTVTANAITWNSTDGYVTASWDETDGGFTARSVS